MTSNHNDRLGAAEIDKSSPLPYHYQLREILRAEIIAERWRRGDQLPSEHQLCDMFQVSRTTVREALDALVNEGLLTREKGLGTFVTDPKFIETWTGSAIGYSDSITQQGYLIETKVLQLGTMPAPVRVRQELNLQANENVVFLKRLRYIMKQPILIVSSYMPVKTFPGMTEIDFTVKSLYQTFRLDYNLPVTRVKRSIEAIAADEDVAGHLELPVGFPIMYIENTAYSNGGAPIEYYNAWRRGDKSRFEFEYSQPQPSGER
ncbi:MAG: GntR family transcriptional regulator [Anaerolineae bacterium]|nr:GntR family transcriptional regulator [Anaerolineae bacterium]